LSISYQSTTGFRVSAIHMSKEKAQLTQINSFFQASF